MPQPKRRERQLIQDYIITKYPTHRVIYDCPLGLPPTRLIATFGLSKALRMGRGARPMVDALVFEGNTLILVEAKIREWMNGLAKLPVYKAMIPDTPELEEYHNYAVKMILAIPYNNETIQAVADRLGIIVDEFTSPVVEEVMQEVAKYWTPEHRKAMAEKRRTLELLGLD